MLRINLNKEPDKPISSENTYTFLDFHRFSFKIVEAPEEICRDVRWVFIKAQKKS
jgi:hypothetical protein